MVCPVRVLPLRSLTVAEIIRGRRSDGSVSVKVSSAYTAALALSASKQVSRSIMSAPPSIRPRSCSSYAEAISSKPICLKAGSEMSWARVSDLDVGPTLPATQTLRGASSADLRARRAAWRAIS